MHVRRAATRATCLETVKGARVVHVEGFEATSKARLGGAGPAHEAYETHEFCDDTHELLGEFYKGPEE